MYVFIVSNSNSSSCLSSFLFGKIFCLSPPRKRLDNFVLIRAFSWVVSLSDMSPKRTSCSLMQVRFEIVLTPNIVYSLLDWFTFEDIFVLIRRSLRNPCLHGLRTQLRINWYCHLLPEDDCKQIWHGSIEKRIESLVFKGGHTNSANLHLVVPKIGLFLGWQLIGTLCSVFAMSWMESWNRHWSPSNHRYWLNHGVSWGT